MTANADLILVALNGIAQAMNEVSQAIAAQTIVIENVFPQQNGLASSAVAGLATLPAAPVGFVIVTLENGDTAKIPYYS